MQCEIKEAVNQDCKASGKCSGCDAATKTIIRLAAHKTLTEKYHDECQTQYAADDSTIRNDLQIVVVRLFQTKQSVMRVVTSVDHAESTEPGADVWIRLDNIQSYVPEVRAARGRIRSRRRSQQTRKRFRTAKADRPT